VIERGKKTEIKKEGKINGSRCSSLSLSPSSKATWKLNKPCWHILHI